MNKEKKANFHRENIIAASDNLFREFGVENTTMGMISKLSDYSTATIYVYFSGKAEIFDSLVYRIMLEVKKNIDDIINSDASYEEKYFSICYGLVALQKSSPIYFEGMISHINMNIYSDETPTLYKDIFELGNQINESLFVSIEQGIKEGILSSEIDKYNLTFFMWGSVMGIVRMIAQKKDYFMLNNVTEKELLQFSFAQLLKAIKK